MRLFGKSIIRKLFIVLLLSGLLIGSAVYFLYFRIQTIPPFYVLISAMGLFVFSFLFFYWWIFSRPFKAVLMQIQALLIGDSYKRIYSTRIDEIGILAHFFNQITKSFGKVSSNLTDRERMVAELSIASQLQKDILPTENISVSGLQIAAKNKPATELGGDIFDFVSVGTKTYIYVGDVTGHGAAAGLMMAMVNSLVNVFADVCKNSFEIVVNVNKYIKKRVKRAMYMTMVMLCWDNKTDKLTYVGAGHEHILFYHSDTGECEAVLSGGTALGMLPDNSKVVSEKELAVKDGDFVILYTDGITEAKNVQGEMFGLENLKKSVIEYAPQYSADGVNYHIAKDVSSFVNGHLQEDDMTLIVLRRDSKITGKEKPVDLSTVWKD